MLKEQSWSQLTRLIVIPQLLCAILTGVFALSGVPQDREYIRETAEAAVLQYVERAGVEIGTCQQL